MNNAVQSWHTIEHDWFHQPVTPPFSYALVIRDGILGFHARRNAAPHCDRSLAAGTFKEGLWEQEVAEFFLAEEGTTRYLEVNLAPSGAWWWCLFDEYRVRSHQQPIPPAAVQVRGECLERAWWASIELPLLALPFALSPSGRQRCNVTAVTFNPHKQYVTATPLQADKPDFHLVKHFRHWQLCE